MLTQRACAQAKSTSIPVVGKSIGKANWTFTEKQWFHMIPLIPIIPHCCWSNSLPNHHALSFEGQSSQACEAFNIAGRNAQSTPALPECQRLYDTLCIFQVWNHQVWCIVERCRKAFYIHFTSTSWLKMTGNSGRSRFAPGMGPSAPALARRLNALFQGLEITPQCLFLPHDSVCK